MGSGCLGLGWFLQSMIIAGDNVDCWMEIQHGKGPWANPVSGIVPLGTTLTMVIGINDKQGETERKKKTNKKTDTEKDKDKVSGIAPLGTTLTMVIGINDKQGETEKDKVRRELKLKGMTMKLVVDRSLDDPVEEIASLNRPLPGSARMNPPFPLLQISLRNVS